MTEVLNLTKELVKRRSVTPNDDGCQDLIAKRLDPCGFQSEAMNFGDVKNIWTRKGKTAPLFVFLGHTDVVPPGPEADWQIPPFEPTEKAGYLYGRGTADMKGNIAAFIIAAERFVASHPEHPGSIALLLTSDEEGVAIDGTVKVVEKLVGRGEKIDYCLVGEPSSVNQVGDVLKNGRRGSLGGRLFVEGIQGHAAYPERALNPIHKVLGALAELSAKKWDNGNEFFPATSFQITNINSGTGADNVIPGNLEAWFNFRFCTESNAEELKKKVHEILDASGAKYKIEWRLSGSPFLTGSGKLVEAVQKSVREVAGLEPQLSTAGGTSDGRFVAPTGAQVIELGLINDTIHKVNECVRIDDLELLTKIYERVLENVLL